MSEIHEDYLRSILFGLQDGLVSTTGVVIGISTGVDTKAIILLAAFVAVTVEATSMAAGQYSSEKAVHQLDGTGKHTDSLIWGAVLMFVSYLIAGLIPITPFVLTDPNTARVLAIIFAFLGLFAVGFIKGKLVKVSPVRSAVELFVIGAVATSIGLIVGQILKV